MPAIYVDVDDTLIRSFGSKRLPITHMVELIRGLRDRGAELYCWSSGGAAYARESATTLGIADCFVAFLPKPTALLDDVATARWPWVELHPNECMGLTADELLAKL